MFDALMALIENGGYWGVGLLMFIENIFPPIPSELIMPLAGIHAARGDMNLFLVIFSGTVGSVIGLLPWYFLGYFFRYERVKALAAKYGRFLAMTPRDVEKAHDWFNRFGMAAVFFGRLIPAIRTLISIPAGLVRMAFIPFMIYSTLGTIIWISFLTSLGYLLDSHYTMVAGWLDLVTILVVVSAIAIYIYRFVTFPSHLRKQQQEEQKDKSGQ